MFRECLRWIGAAASVAMVVGGTGLAQRTHGDATRPVLPAGLGSLHHPIRTVSKDAQQLMDEGLTLLYGFNRDAARRAFEVAIRADRDAPMLYAGLALALGPNLNMDSSAAEILSACEASKRAASLATEADESGYASALAARYCRPNAPDAAAYADAMRAFHDGHPDDADAAVLYADSLLALRPRTPRQDEEIVHVLEAVLQKHPDHVGANHYYVHAVEGTATPERGLASAKRLETLVPGIGHLLHMPSHIYMRTGDYEAAVAGNRKAAAADLAYLRTNPPGHDGAMYYLHDLEALAVAAGFVGRFAEARAAAQEVARVEAELSGRPAVEHFSPPIAMVLLRFQRWADVESLPVPPDTDAAAAFLSRFARGVAFAARGAFAKARGEREAFTRVVRSIPAHVRYRSNPITVVAPVYEAALDARLAAEGEPAVSVGAWERAVAAQDRLEYHEPPPFYYPMRESLGATLLAAGRPADAEQVFRKELAQHPKSGRALLGLWRALEARHADAEAARIHTAFVKAWSGSDVQLSLSEY
jgi:tetratricopeptide (TPR) repeat protein